MAGGLNASIIFHQLSRIQRKTIIFKNHRNKGLDYGMLWFIHKTMLERPTCNSAFGSGLFQEQNQ